MDRDGDALPVLIVAIITAVALLMPPVASAAKAIGACSVTPNVQAGQTLTVTASANVLFDFDLVGTDGVVYVWPQSAPGTVSYQWATNQTGRWLMEVNAVRNDVKHVLATCPFTVT